MQNQINVSGETVLVEVIDVINPGFVTDEPSFFVAFSTEHGSNMVRFDHDMLASLGDPVFLQWLLENRVALMNAAPYMQYAENSGGKVRLHESTVEDHRAFFNETNIYASI